MILVKASHEILTPISEGGIEELQRIELAARTCYKSEDRITPDGESAKKLVKSLIKRGHEAMLEHSMLSVKFICDRGVSHELVRHRLASYAQESTRWCNYSNDKFGNEIAVIEPCFDNTDGLLRMYWYRAMRESEERYFDLLSAGAAPQMARSVLPNSLKTEVVMTANYREWRNVFKLRCASDAHPQMRELMIPLCVELQKKLPIIFDDCYPLGQEILERDDNEKPISGKYPFLSEERKSVDQASDLSHRMQIVAAKTLWLGDYSIEQIAKEMRLSESTVLNLLKEAGLK